MTLQSLLASIESRFDKTFSVMDEADGGWMYPPSPIAVKAFIKQSHEEIIQAVVEEIDLKRSRHRCAACDEKVSNLSHTLLCRFAADLKEALLSQKDPLK